MRVEDLKVGTRFLSAVRGYLDIGRAPEKVDCIFVYAGRPERKVYGANLFKQGYAQRIVFSVGRFEWRRFGELGIARGSGLEELIETTPPRERHFFVCVDGNGASSFLVRRGRFGTLSEAAALATFVRREGISSVMVVSSDFHLRRCVEAIERYCTREELRIVPVAGRGHNSPDEGGTRALISQAVLLAKECSKYVAYKLLAWSSSRWDQTRSSSDAARH